MWLSFTVVSAPSRTHSYGPCFSVLPLALLFSLLLPSPACVKSVHSVSNDNFYIVRANHTQTKDRRHAAKSHQQASSKSELIQESKAVKAKTKTNITNPDVLEQKHPVVASLLEKIQHEPGNPQNHYELASVYHRLQIFDKALLEYEKAIEFASENAEYYEGMGRLWRDWGTPTSGISYLQKALDLRSSYPEAWNTLGTIYDQLGNFSEAQRCYLNALALNSELDFVYSNLCFSYLQTGEVQDAIYYGERAVQLNPDLIQARNNLGAAYGMADDFIRAIEQFKLIGDEAEAHNNLGVLLLKKQRNVEAMEEFKLAVRLKPFYKVAAQNYRTAQSLVVRNRTLQKQSALAFTDWLPLDVSFGADSLDFSVPLIDLQSIQACSYLWASGAEQRNQELLARPRANTAKEYEFSPDLRRTIFARN